MAVWVPACFLISHRGLEPWWFMRETCAATTAPPSLAWESKVRDIDSTQKVQWAGYRESTSQQSSNDFMRKAEREVNKGHLQIQTTSLCMSISMSANVALACIFSPKIWIILFEKHKNVRKQDGMFSKRCAICTTIRWKNVMPNAILEMLNFSQVTWFLCYVLFGKLRCQIHSRATSTGEGGICTGRLACCCISTASGNHSRIWATLVIFCNSRSYRFLEKLVKILFQISESFDFVNLANRPLFLEACCYILIIRHFCHEITCFYQKLLHNLLWLRLICRDLMQQALQANYWANSEWIKKWFNEKESTGQCTAVFGKHFGHSTIKWFALYWNSQFQASRNSNPLLR